MMVLTPVGSWMLWLLLIFIVVIVFAIFRVDKRMEQARKDVERADRNKYK